MNSLLTEVLQWLHNNGYRRASFDRIIGIVPSASTYEQLTTLVNQNDDIFRATIIKGGLPGLAIQDGVDVAEALTMARGNVEEEAEPMTAPCAQAEPVIPATAVSPYQIELEIADEYYRNLGSAVKASPESTLNNVTICALVLQNGFVIIGKSACVDPANYNEERGRQLAREDAIKQVWPLLGFRLADKRLAA